MIIGVPKEIKVHEYRVGLTPNSVFALTTSGHEVYLETNAGAAVGFSDRDYIDVGAKILPDAQAVFDIAELIVKVKEPQAVERAMLKPNQTLFTYLHLAPDPEQANDLLQSGCTAIAYETVTADDGSLPLLVPMSEVAGRLSVQAAAFSLEKHHGGEGILLGGVPGVEPAEVVVVGGGIVGSNAVQIAVGMGARVTVLDRSLNRLRWFNNRYGAEITTLYADQKNLRTVLPKTDVVIGAVLIPGDAAPKLLTRTDLKIMRSGCVLVDVSIDQGGCFETSRPTTHLDPTYTEENIVHYCVANMPGAVPRTSTQALNNATLPFVLDLANKGPMRAMAENKHLANGLNVYSGSITHASVARALKLDYTPLSEVIKSEV